MYWDKWEWNTEEYIYVINVKIWRDLLLALIIWKSSKMPVKGKIVRDRLLLSQKKGRKNRSKNFK